jgi:cytochrome P450
MTELATLPKLDDPRFYLDNPYPTFAWMRREEPVLFFPELRTHAITRYADIRLIGRSPELYCSGQGMLLNDAKYGNVADSFFPDGAELITTSDPPRHRELRRVISPSFAAPVMARMETFVREKAKQLVATIEPDTEFDFIEQIAVVLPIQVICSLLGIEDASIDDVRFWSDQMVRMGGNLSADELGEIANSLGPLNEFLLAQIEDKRGHIGSDLLSTLLRAEIDNEKLTDLNVLMLTTATLVAGNETTRNLIADTIALLAEHPDQRRRLRDEPALSATAVDEALRYASPVTGFIRTATADTELHGRPIREGEHVYLIYMAGNRDDEVFAEPDRFDVARSTQPAHLAFGYGEHVCPGASLARLEARVLLEELLARYPEWQIGSGAEPILSVLSNGYLRLPTTFSAR